MSILIKGMKLPSNCFECPLETDYGTCGYYSFYVEAGHDSDYRKRRDDCPLIEVPTPHGRLIDTDSTVEVELYDDEHEEWKTKFMSVETYLGYCYNEVPTIIEAGG